LIIRLDEEVTVLDVVRRINDGLRKEKVTKQFYERFQQEHDAFLHFVQGIAREADQRWYASVMLNRLMFVYFIQRKGFLNGETDYLRTRLSVVREHGTPFLSFYKHFLRHLFHEGLSKKPAERQPHLDRLLGRIPISTVACSTCMRSSLHTRTSTSQMTHSSAFSTFSMTMTGT
jgi:hypothetical protein